MTSVRKAFTLIELLIVVVIIGIIASIAIPKYVNTKEKAYIANMKADLRNLMSAQEAYYADNNAYANSTTVLGTQYKSSTGITVTIYRVAVNGWRATATHASTTHYCRIYLGTFSRVEGATVCF